MNSVRLTTPRLVLRELRLEDWADAQVLDSDPLVVRYQSNDVLDEVGTKAYLSRSIAAAKVPSSVKVPMCIVYDLENGLITHGRIYIEMPVMLQQLGVVAR